MKNGRSANLQCVMPRDISLLGLKHVARDNGTCTVTDAPGFPSVFMRVYRIAESDCFVMSLCPSAVLSAFMKLDI